MNAIFNLKRFKNLVSLFVVFAMLANVAAPAFAETKKIERPEMTGWGYVKTALAGGLGGWAIGALLPSAGPILAVAGLSLPIIPILVGAAVAVGIAAFIMKTTKGIDQGIISPHQRELEEAQRAAGGGGQANPGGGLLGTPMDTGVGSR